MRDQDTNRTQGDQLGTVKALTCYQQGINRAPEGHWYWHLCPILQLNNQQNWGFSFQENEKRVILDPKPMILVKRTCNEINLNLHSLM